MKSVYFQRCSCIISLCLDSLQALKSMVGSFKSVGTRLCTIKFSREFETNHRVKWDFTGTKVLNSLENLEVSLRLSHSSY